MTYAEAIDYWFGRVNFERTAPAAADLRLDRMRRLLDELGNPQARLRIVHVAGSKGKGSTAAMIASILERAGQRVGLFTSPHLSEVEERIQIDRKLITRDELAACMKAICAAAGRLPGPEPTFFEIATALGFVHFAHGGVNVAVVEVGLGGRFDATNVCTPLVSVITSISFDHTQILGNRLGSIAMEKAGIVKPQRPVISGATAAEPREVIESICREREAPLWELGRDFHFQYEPGHFQLQGNGWKRKPRVRIKTPQRQWPSMEVGLLGEHQAANAAVAVACIELLQTNGLRIDDQAVAAGLAGVRWPARLEIARRRPLVLLDCAHNLASVQALLDTLAASFPITKRSLIFAASADKDVAGMLGLLASAFEPIYLTGTSNARSLAAEQLAAFAQPLGITVTVCHDPHQAWLAALKDSALDDMICITGSVFLAGDLRREVVHKHTGKGGGEVPNSKSQGNLKHQIPRSR